MTHRNRRTLLIVLAAALPLLSAGAALHFTSMRLPDRFAAVEPGRLYRSGDVTPGQLQRLQRDHGIRRVISLLNPDVPESRAERQTCAALGLSFHNIPMGGNGASTPADRERLLALLRDESAGPTLVHCAAGTNRTGLAVGLYRLHEQGWPLEGVMAELKQFDFEDEPHHENMRQALADAARAAASRPQSR